MPKREKADQLASDYIIRGIDAPVWKKVKARAALEGRPVRDVIIGFLEAYARGLDKTTPKSRPR